MRFDRLLKAAVHRMQQESVVGVLVGAFFAYPTFSLVAVSAKDIRHPELATNVTGVKGKNRHLVLLLLALLTHPLSHPTPPPPPLFAPGSSFSSGGSSSSWTIAGGSSSSSSSSSRRTQAVDIFSLGCIFHHCIVPGSHPFGQWYEREANIIQNKAR